MEDKEKKKGSDRSTEKSPSKSSASEKESKDKDKEKKKSKDKERERDPEDKEKEREKKKDREKKEEKDKDKERKSKQPKVELPPAGAGLHPPLSLTASPTPSPSLPGDVGVSSPDDPPLQSPRTPTSPMPSRMSNSTSTTSLVNMAKYKYATASLPPMIKRDSIFNLDFRMDDQKMDKHVRDLETQILIEKKIMTGAESIIREYSNQKKVDKKTLANAEATLAQSKDRIDELNDELTRFKTPVSSDSPTSPVSALRREMSVSDLNDVETLSTADVSSRIQRLMEKIEIEMTVKAGAEKMAKALSMASQKPDKPMEDIFKSLSNSSARITLMMTALQKYQCMTVTDPVTPVHTHPADRSSGDDESTSNDPFVDSPSNIITPSSAIHKRQNLTGKLTIKIVSAKNLIKYEALTEAVCVIRVDNVVKCKTKPKFKTVKPIWNETFVINLDAAGEIEFEVFDETSLRGLVFFKFQEVDLTQPLNAWVEVEPQGKLHIQLAFVKSVATKRKLSQTGRRGAVRKRKVLTVEGHKLEPKRVYQLMKCAACAEVMLSVSCYQCKDCQYLCHRKCYKQIHSKCITEMGSSNSVEKFNSPHKWELVSVATPNFCSHCGHMLPLGKKRVHKCLECGIYAHTRCGSLFLPDNCGQIPLSATPNRKIEKLSKKSRSDSHVLRSDTPEKAVTKKFFTEDNHPTLKDFTFIKTLGRGNFGKVLLIQEKKTKNLYAMKVLKKEFIIENDEIPSIKTEKIAFQTANRDKHPFLISLHSCFQTETRIYFIMDYVPGGDLMLHIQRLIFSEARAKFYAAEVLLALEYFHNNNIIYRDLKLDNVMLGLDGHIKIADYGLCKALDSFNGKTNTFCGTPEFMAPEILKEQMYGRSVDWWAFGVFLYEMLLAEAPFQGQDEDEIFEAIMQEELTIPADMDKNAADLVKKLLVRDPSKRLGCGLTDALEIKKHPYFEGIDFDKLLKLEIPPPYKPFVVSETDTGNFDPSFTKQPACITPIQGNALQAADQEEFEGFSYTAPWLTEEL